MGAGSQGPHLPGVGVNVEIGNVNWMNPGNVVSDNGVLAQTDLPALQSSDYLAATQFGFQLPGGVINGIVVELNDATLEDPTVTGEIHLTKNGTNAVGTGQPYNTATGWATYGSPTDLWGATWTPNEINASTFGALLFASNSHASQGFFANIDAIRIIVHYTAPDARYPLFQQTKDGRYAKVVKMSEQITNHPDPVVRRSAIRG